MWKLAILVTTLCSIHKVMSNSPPSFIDTGSVSRPEDFPTGCTLFNLSATDPDGDTLSFAIPSPTTAALVSLGNSHTNGNVKTREIILLKELDRDFSPATILLIITDVNDEPPKFDEPGYRVSVKESENVGYPVTTVKATDPDTSSGGQVYYGLKARGQSSDEYIYTFIIDKVSGRITLNESLDYEDRTFYQYNVTAWDDNPDENNAGNHAVPVDFFVTVLDVQDTPPFFRNQPYIHTIDENVTIGTSVLKVLASDGDIGVSNQIEYYFLQGDSDSDSFAIDANHGDITTTVLLDADSEEMKQKGGVLSFHVNASEVFPASQEQLGDTSSSTQVTVTIRDVNDNAPNFTSNVIVAEVFENTPKGVPLTLTSSVEVEDKDMTSTNNLFELFVEKNGALYFDFDTIPGKNQPVSRSNIMIRVNNTELLDYEVRDNVTFQIVAKESQSYEKLSSSVSVVVNIINVNDNSPVFKNSTYTFSISENASINDVVGQVLAHDADSGTFGEVTYHLDDTDTDFNISETDGEMTVSKGLDRERQSFYSLLVLAYDNDIVGRRTGQTRVDINIIDVNDNDPKFVGNTLTIPLVEDAANGTIVTTVTATDADEGSNAAIEYFIKDDSNATGRFDVNSTTGVVTVAAPLVSFTGIRYIIMEARDKGQPPRSGEQTLVFSIRDVNLHSPVFTHPEGEFNPVNRSVVQVFEERPTGDEIFVYKATDDDVGNNGKVYYSIEPGHDSEKFFINFTSGQLVNLMRLDRETRRYYEIQVVARDGGNPSLQATLPVTVRLLDIDDNEPFFPNKTFPDRLLTISVLEETLGCMVDNVSHAEDADEWVNNTKRCYYIQGGDKPYTQYININKTTGAVCLTKELDRDEIPSVNILVKVSSECTLTGTPDQPFDSKFNKSDGSILHVKVVVEDINDNPPVFADNGQLSLGILYDTGVGEVVHNLRDDVTDADEGTNAITYFRDLGQTGSDIDNVGKAAFSVSINGSVSTNRLFSSTMLGYVEIAVEAYDIGNLTARASLKIYIVSNIQRVKIIFNKQPEEVRQIKNAFVRELEELLDYIIIVEKIASHQLPDKSTVDGRTDMFIHAEYPEGGLVPASDLWRAFDFTRGIALVFSKYGVTETSPVVDNTQTDDGLSRTLSIVLILVASILTIIAVSLGIALFCVREKYARRLRAERVAVSTSYMEKEPAPPGTNLYTAASNPVFMKEDIIREEDEESIDLDDNAVDNAEVGDALDEQEMTISIDSPDALRTMTKSSVLDDVLTKYAEVEKNKMKDDKQSLIDEQGSDGDSGFYTPMKGLEQSDI